MSKRTKFVSRCDISQSRAVMRSQLKRGLITREVYEASRRSDVILVYEQYARINKPIRKWAKAMRAWLEANRDPRYEGIEIAENNLAQCFLREASLHPTKGWRTRRGKHVEAA